VQPSGCSAERASSITPATIASRLFAACPCNFIEKYSESRHLLSMPLAAHFVDDLQAPS
jgi:hypothetical protein